MQVWKMAADGTGQQQVTDDGFNNWFPHISPDGKSMVILSFDQSVDADDHPFYKHVYIRLLQKKGERWSDPTIIALKAKLTFFQIFGISKTPTGAE